MKSKSLILSLCLAAAFAQDYTPESPTQLKGTYRVLTLPAQSVQIGALAVVLDGNGTDCATPATPGAKQWCRWNGHSWDIVSGGGAAFPSITDNGNQVTVSKPLSVGTTCPAGVSATLCTSVLYSPNGALNVKAFGAIGDGSTDDSAAITRGVNAAIAGNSLLYFPAGTYNTSTGILNTAALVMFGSGDSSILQVTSTGNGAWAVKTQASLTIRDMRITLQTPVDVDHGTVGVFKKDTDTPSTGITIVLDNVTIDGFNFSLNVAGSGAADLLKMVVVRSSRLSIRQNPGSVGEPVNIRSAQQATVSDSVLTSANKGDHGVYTIGVANLNILGTQILNPYQYGIKAQTLGSETIGTWLFQGLNIVSPSVGILANPQGTSAQSLVSVRDVTISAARTTTAGEAPVMFSVSNTASIAQVSVDGLHVVGSPLGCITFGGSTGTIYNASVSNSSCWNFSTNASGVSAAVTDSTATFGRIKIDGLYVNCGSTGRQSYILGNAFAAISAANITEVNCTAPQGGSYRFNTPAGYSSSAFFPAANANTTYLNPGDVYQDAGNALHFFGMKVAPGNCTYATRPTASGQACWCTDCDAPGSPGAACTSAGAKAGAEAHGVRGSAICF